MGNSLSQKINCPFLWHSADTWVTIHMHDIQPALSIGGNTITLTVWLNSFLLQLHADTAAVNQLHADTAAVDQSLAAKMAIHMTKQGGDLWTISGGILIFFKL